MVLNEPSINHHLKQQSKAYGFTIIELITTLSIAGILAGVVIASFYQSYERERLRAASRILAGWLDEQRRAAIQNSSPCDVSIDISDTTALSKCDSLGSTLVTFDLASELNDDKLVIENISGGTCDPIWSFSPRGTVAQAETTSSLYTAGVNCLPTTANLELRLSLNGSNASNRCIYLTYPLGVIKQARLTVSGTCDYTKVL